MSAGVSGRVPPSAAGALLDVPGQPSSPDRYRVQRKRPMPYSYKLSSLVCSGLACRLLFREGTKGRWGSGGEGRTDQSDTQPPVGS